MAYRMAHPIKEWEAYEAQKRRDAMRRRVRVIIASIIIILVVLAIAMAGGSRGW